MTIAPAAAKRSAWAREVDAPAEKSATSMPARSAVSVSSTTTSPSPQGQRCAGGPRAGEEPDPLDREAPLGEQAAHDAADLPGGADDRDGEPAHRPVPP